MEEKIFSEIFHRDGVYKAEEDAVIALNKASKIYSKLAERLEIIDRGTGPYFMGGDSGMYIVEYRRKARLYRDTADQILKTAYK